MSLGDWRIMRQRVQDSIAIAVRVYSGPGVLPATYNFLVCEFGGFENVLCDAGIYIITDGADVRITQYILKASKLRLFI